MYKLLAIILISLAAFSVAYSHTHDIEVVASDESQFHFILKVDSDLSNIESAVDADGFRHYYRTILVGVPVGADVRLLASDGRGLTVVDNGSIASGAVTASALVELLSVQTIRDRQFVPAVIHPVASGQVYQEVEVRLGFAGGSKQQQPASFDPAFDPIFSSSIANYEQARRWPTLVRVRAGVAKVAVDPFSIADSWVKLSVDRTGLCKTTAAQLEAVGLFTGSIPSDSLHLFSGGGLPLDPDNSLPRPTFAEVSIVVEDGGDGLFSGGDQILFFAEAVDRWTYDTSGTPLWVNNLSTDRNVYWLAASAAFGSGGRRMSSVDATPTGATTDTISEFTCHLHVEQDNLLRKKSSGKISNYNTWYWTDQSALSFSVATPGATMPADTAIVLLAGRTGGGNSTTGYIDLSVNGVGGLDKSCDRFRNSCRFRTVSLTDNLPFNDIVLNLQAASDALPYFDFMEISYRSRLLPVSGQLDARLDPFAGRALLEVVNNFSSEPIILEVGDPQHPKLLTGFQRGLNLITFEEDLDAVAVNRIYVSSTAMTPAAIELVSPVDLRADTAQTDLIIVAPALFVSALGEYVDFRGSAGTILKIVTTESIMDNFAGGLYDPTAIRDYLKFAYESYSLPAPSAVLFVGDGSYDFLNNLHTGQPNYVPPFLLLSGDLTIQSDDGYVYFGRDGILDSDTSWAPPDDRGYDMMTARWPVSSTGEIRSILAKVKRYESKSNLGSWRAGLLSVADDEFGETGSDREIIHVQQAEELVDRYLPDLFKVDKVYLWDFPLLNRERPEVNDAIVREFNEGALIVNYVGHGNPDLWAHEHVFTRGADLPRLTNSDRLPLVFAASCAIGFFDDPQREGMAEDLTMMPSGGAIATISATRTVYSSPNAAFNRKAFEQLFGSDSLSICAALYTAKLMRQYGALPYPSINSNDRFFVFFGDPLLRLGVPQLEVQFDSIPGPLMRLRRQRVSGRIVNRDGTDYVGDGVVAINISDTRRTKTYQAVGASSVTYTVEGPTIFRGSAGIVDGTFGFEFIVPVDVGYGGQGAGISLYAVLDGIDAAGAVDSLAVSDSLAPSADSDGPSIEYGFNGRDDFVEGSIISDNDRLEIVLADSAGINLTGSLGHGISLQVDDRSDRVVNLTELFEYDRDDFTRGSLSYQLQDVTPGRHRFKIKAWDNANNSASVEFSVEVSSGGSLAIVDLLNYPNPMGSRTDFSFQLTARARSFSLEIFTVSGRRIKSFSPMSLDPGYHESLWAWDGTDADGDRVATGVYIYKATALPYGEGEAAQSFGKVVLINN